MAKCGGDQCKIDATGARMASKRHHHTNKQWRVTKRRTTSLKKRSHDERKNPRVENAIEMTTNQSPPKGNEKSRRTTVAATVTVTKTTENLEKEKKTNLENGNALERKAAANVPNEITTMTPVLAAAIVAAVKIVGEDENERRKAARKRRKSEKAASALPKTVIAVTTTTRPDEAPSQARKSRCTLKRMLRIWPMNVPEKKCCSFTTLPSIKIAFHSYLRRWMMLL